MTKLHSHLKKGFISILSLTLILSSLNVYAMDLNNSNIIIEEDNLDENIITTFNNVEINSNNSKTSTNNININGNLNEKRIEATNNALNNFKYTTTNLNKWDGSESNCYNDGIFNVYNASQFAYALHYAGTYANSTINILNDIDMNGENFTFVNLVDWNNITLNGNNHIIYNLHISNNAYVGLCLTGTNCTIKNVIFEYLFMEGTGWHGLIPYTNPGVYSHYDNVYVNNSIGGSSLNAGYGGALGGYGACRVTDCGTNNFTSIGSYHIGGLFGLYEPGYFKDCYSIDGLVINSGGHGGGFAACSDEASYFENCITNNTCYGTSDMGGFTSGCDGGGFAGFAVNETILTQTIYKNCFSSGVVESDSFAGGFCGKIENYKTGLSISVENKTLFINCYSSAMVGMNYNAGYLGGFVGYDDTGRCSYNNCYATGEVGSIDTNINTTNTSGGFIGYWKEGSNCSNCYYDMSTTAMKNKAIGNIDLSQYVLNRDSNGVKTNTYLGITGVTTKYLTNSESIMGSDFYYIKGLYPQIKTIANNNNVIFKAYSAASASTIFCNEWDDISSIGFDTIRDTMRNMAFSSNIPFTNNNQFNDAYVNDKNITTIDWIEDGNISPIDKKTKVIKLSNSSPYYTTELYPGIEWVTVKLKYTDENGNFAIGSRRLRIIPTSIITSGIDERVDVFHDTTKTSLYNHKEGFNTTYIDNTILYSLLNSSTTNTQYLKTFNDVSHQTYNNGVISGNINLSFNNNYTNLDVTTTIINQNTNNLVNIPNLYQKLNGTQKFTINDVGNYKITYKITLSDGRYLSASKNLLIVIPYSVSYYYNYEGLNNGLNIYSNSLFYIQQELDSFNNFILEKYSKSPTRDGYYFIGWSLDKEGKQIIDQNYFDSYNSKYGNLNENISLYAQWKPLKQSTLTINPNGGTYNNKTSNITYNGITNQTLTLNNPIAPIGKYFIGWKLILGDGVLDGGIYTYKDNASYIEAQYSNQKLKVNYIDRIINTTIDLGSKELEKEYGETISGEDLGNDKSIGAYYPKYAYVSSTSSTVGIDGAIVYRYFKLMQIDKNVTISWNDNNNSNKLRPKNVTLTIFRNGSKLKDVVLDSTTTSYTFESLDIMDSNDKEYSYTFYLNVNERYNVQVDGNTINASMKPTTFDVIIPKTITLNGSNGKCSYNVKVNGNLYLNDNITITPSSSFTLKDKSSISSLQANVTQTTTSFTKNNLGTTNGNINLNKTKFAGTYNGNFNFNIKLNKSN